MKKHLHFQKTCVIIIKQSGKNAKKLITVGIVDVEGTPVPIPNTEVKLNSAENTWVAAPRENRKMPTFEVGYVLYPTFSYL